MSRHVAGIAAPKTHVTLQVISEKATVQVARTVTQYYVGDRAPNTHKILTMSIFDPEVISLGQASLFIDDRMNPLQSKFRSLPGRVSHPIKTPNNRLQTHYNRKSDPSKIIFPTRRDGLRWDVLGATEPILSLPRAYQLIAGR